MSGNKYIVVNEGNLKISDIVNDCNLKLTGIRVKRGDSLISILEKISAHTSSGGTVDINTIVNSVIASYITDYDNNIIGARDNSNTIYTLRYNYVSGSTEVYLGGLRLTPGPTSDYLELGNKQIQFNYPVEPEQNILVKYIKSN